MKTHDKVQELTASLRSKDGAQREKARNALVRLGKPAVGPLIELLADKNQHVRWEACKALGRIRDPAAAAPLVDALRDDSIEIQWLAAEALIALGPEALVHLLQALEKHFDSVLLRQGAHHVLHALERKRVLNQKTLAVLDSLRSLSPESPIAMAAYEALASLSKAKRLQTGRLS
jgi:HEAT repeat protein